MALSADAANDFVNIMTADVSWYNWPYDHSLSWRTSRDPVPTRELQQIALKKSIFLLVYSAAIAYWSMILSQR
jgi:hypothetical protein